VPLSLFVRVRSDTRSDSFDREGASDDASDGEIFENCIEKNFHVPKHESGHWRTLSVSVSGAISRI